ncbi:MAG TPA: HlyD family efflux transporter periplasmic adaptor subunit [Candidatus Udaeobacter sp.]|jgi:multidrug efflux pump subunit AcrA (membrane-fusion protein)|nr:HlyD family efflux transporter periplasmic adaptor subunit [Candidatus Udaeobacter sp.]
MRDAKARGLAAATLILSAALQIALLAGCGAKKGDSPAGAEPDTSAEPAALVKVAALSQRTFDDEITVSGQWKSSGDVLVAAPFDGVLESVSVRPGDHVAAGAALATLVTRESDAAVRGAELMVRSARDATERAEAARAVALARRERVRVPVMAPHSGVVTRRAAEPGAQLAQAAEILTLVPDQAIVFEARVPPRDAPRLKRGQHAVVVEEGPVTRAARLDRILPTAGNGDQTTLCWLAREGGGKPPSLDRFASARITLGPPHAATAVPDTAVVEDDLTGSSRIAVLGPDSHITWTVVMLGPRAQGFRELRSPQLPLTTQVLIEGQRGLPDHSRVRVTP